MSRIITLSDEGASKARETLDRQIFLLNNKERSRIFQKDVLEKIQRTRAEKGRSRIDPIDLSGKPEEAEFVVAVGGEVLVNRKDIVAATDLLQGQGWSAAATLSTPAFPGSTGALSQRVARFLKPDARVKEAARVVDQLIGQGIQASVNYVLPLGYVAKGEGGFEPAAINHQEGPGPNPGSGARVAVIDTGIAPKRNDGWLVNIARNADNRDDLYQDPPAPPDLLDYAAGHGNFVCGIIQQVAPTAQIRMYRAIGSDGIGNDVQVAEAILVAAQDGAQVINLSLGTPSRGKDRPVATQAALEILAENHEEIVVVASAGNSPNTQLYYPAAFPRVQSVASVQANLQGSDWSSHSADVDFSAVGEGVCSTYVVGLESRVVDKTPDRFDPPSWAIGTGTSFAAPQIVGEIADRMASTAGRTAWQACNDLKAGGTPLRDYGVIVKILPGTPR